MKLPILPTILVLIAVAVMVRLGFWQLARADEKQALLARYEQNSRLPPMALPRAAVADERIVFRRASAFCLEVTGWRTTGGQAATGQGGTRHVADCRSGAEGPGFAADMGVAIDPKAKPAWKGGEVSGTIVPEPATGGVIARLLGRAPPPRPMIVSEQPAPGLQASARPTRQAVSNNHLLYAIQWFFFAAAALAVYLLALRRRQRSGVVADAPPNA